MTSEPSPPTLFAATELPLMSSAEVSRAKTSQWPESEAALMLSGVVYGLNTTVSLASLDLGASSWKTHQACLVSGWEEFSETWPRAGMMRNGTVYPQTASAPLMRGTGHGSLPTPTKTDFKSECMSPELVARRAGESKRGVRLTEFLHRRNLPTPMRGNDHWGARLDEWGGSSNPFRGTELGQLRLNPCWVEELMGFPIGWSELEPSETP